MENTIIQKLFTELPIDLFELFRKKYGTGNIQTKSLSNYRNKCLVTNIRIPDLNENINNLPALYLHKEEHKTSLLLSKKIINDGERMECGLIEINGGFGIKGLPGGDQGYKNLWITFKDNLGGMSRILNLNYPPGLMKIVSELFSEACLRGSSGEYENSGTFSNEKREPQTVF
jgi:hypothetical protein